MYDWIFNHVVDFLVLVLVSYPIVGGIAFIISSIYQRVFNERRQLPAYFDGEPPFVSIFVPAHNEEDSIESTIVYLATQLNYPDHCYEILVINDGSTDATGDILSQLQVRFPSKLRVLTVVDNRGKAHGYNIALGYARGEFILSNDADTKPETDALWKYMSYFKREGGQNVGAVTGNMLVSNRTTLTALVQMNELNSIVGMIKRSQMAYGGLFAFSGANTMYRKAAVFDVGGFQAEQPTEDIAIAWDMQTNGWQALFAPHIRFFLDMPETLRAMFKQRRRWASGDIYVLLTKTGSLLKHPIKNLATMPIIIDYAFSIVWSIFYWISMFLFLALEAYFLFTGNWERFVHGWYMTAMFVTIEVAVGVVQGILASYMNDGGKTLKYLLFLPWYLLVYWMVNTAAMVTEFIPIFLKVLTGDEGGVLKSPERSKSLATINEEISHAN